MEAPTRYVYSRKVLLEIKDLIGKLGAATPIMSAAASSAAGTARKVVPVVRHVAKRASSVRPAITSDERAQLAELQKHFQTRARLALEEKRKAEAEKVEDSKKRAWAHVPMPAAAKVPPPAAATATTGPAAAHEPAPRASQPSRGAHAVGRKKGWEVPGGLSMPAAGRVEVTLPQAPQSRKERQAQRRSRSALVRGEAAAPSPPIGSNDSMPRMMQYEQAYMVLPQEWWSSIYSLAPLYFPVVMPIAVDENGVPWDPSQLPEDADAPPTASAAAAATAQAGSAAPTARTNSREPRARGWQQAAQQARAPSEPSKSKRHRRKESEQAREDRAQRCAAIREKVEALLEEKGRLLAASAAPAPGSESETTCPSNMENAPRDESKTRKRKVFHNQRMAMYEEIANELGAKLEDVVHIRRVLAVERKQALGLPIQPKPRKSRPVLTPAEETRRLTQRERQLELGRATVGYLVWKRHRDAGVPFPHDACAPSPQQACSKRSWDGQVRHWRQMLHKYDELASTVLTPGELEKFNDASHKRRFADMPVTAESLLPAAERGRRAVATQSRGRPKTATTAAPAVAAESSPDQSSA